MNSRCNEAARIGINDNLKAVIGVWGWPARLDNQIHNNDGIKMLRLAGQI